MGGARSARSPRSYLYVPGDAPEKLARARERGADAVIIDLEDAVAPSAKATARESVRSWLLALRPAEESETEIWVRVNPCPLGTADIAAVVVPALTGLCLPKVQGAEEVCGIVQSVSVAEERCSLARSILLQPLIETAKAVVEAYAIARAPRVRQLQIGEIDLAADLGVQPDATATELLFARSQVVVASAAAGVDPPVGPVQAELYDAETLSVTTVALKRLGFGSRACVHPAQVPTVNATFTPTPAEITAASALLNSFDAAREQGLGVGVDSQGRMIDGAGIRSALRLLARAERP